MKLTYKILAISFASLFLFSCSNDSTNPKDESIKDDFNYLSVNFSGEINLIGNNSGKITPYAQFEGLKSNAVTLSTIVSNKDKIFVCEHYPTPNDNLFVFDRVTKKTISKTLVYPDEIIGQEPTLSSLTWDNSKKTLYGVVVNNPYIGAEHKCYFVKINPNTFEVNYTGLNFNQTASISTFLNGTKLYSSYNSGDTFEIDVENNTAKKVLLNNSSFTFSKAAFYSNDIAYFLKKKTTTEGGVTISKMNLIDNTSEDLFSNESLGVSPPNGSGFIDKSTNEYVCYMLKDGFFVLVKFSILNKTYKYIKLTSDISIDNNLIIIDKVNI